MWSQFKEFLLKQNAVALALAVVIGTALNALVQAIVNDLIMPIVTFAVPKDAAWEKYAVELGPFKFTIGHLGSAMLNFIIIGFVAWRISKLIEAKPGPTCPFCKMAVDPAATRCGHCTSQLAKT